MITGFEVLEHYENPVVNLSNIFSYNPKVVLFTTALYNHQKEDWWYLSPEAGQHIFFYSKEAIELISKRYGYNFIISGEFILFIRKLSKIKLIIVRLLLRGKILSFLRSIMSFLPTPGVLNDHLAQVEKSKCVQ